jgi:AcrR family transcriptional regulator
MGAQVAEEKLSTGVRREQIAQAALEIVAADGLTALSIAAVAGRVGLVPSGIYRHYRGKDEILAAVLDLLERRLRSLLAEARASSPDVLERLRDVVRRHVRFVREGRTLPRIIFEEDLHRDHPERRERVRGILSGYLAGVAAIVRDGQAAGRIRGDLEPETAALLVLGVVMPAAMLWHVSEGEFDAEGHVDRAWPLIRDAIAKGGG